MVIFTIFRKNWITLMLHYISCGVLAYYQPWIICLGRFERVTPLCTGKFEILNILIGCWSKKCPFHNKILFSPAKARKSCWQVDICIFWNGYSSSFQPLLHWVDTIIYVHELGNWKLSKERLNLSVTSLTLLRLFTHAMLICSMVQRIYNA